MSAAVETPSGKGRDDENFPVGSWLIRRELRPHVHAFYRFAREADDIADNPSLAAEDKVRRLLARGKSEKEGEQLVDTVDRERVDFIQKYFHVEWPDRAIYHTKINTAIGDGRSST